MLLHVNQVLIHWKTSTHQLRVPYTTLDDVKSFVQTNAQTNGYQYDCIWNNKDKQSVACTYHCSVCPPTPNEIDTICRMKAFGMDNATISGFIGHSEVVVATAIADNCP